MKDQRGRNFPQFYVPEKQNLAYPGLFVAPRRWNRGYEQQPLLPVRFLYLFKKSFSYSSLLSVFFTYSLILWIELWSIAHNMRTLSSSFCCLQSVLQFLSCSPFVTNLVNPPLSQFCNCANKNFNKITLCSCPMTVSKYSSQQFKV